MAFGLWWRNFSIIEIHWVPLCPSSHWGHGAIMEQEWHANIRNWGPWIQFWCHWTSKSPSTIKMLFWTSNVTVKVYHCLSPVYSIHAMQILMQILIGKTSARWAVEPSPPGAHNSFYRLRSNKVRRPSEGWKAQVEISTHVGLWWMICKFHGLFQFGGLCIPGKSKSIVCCLSLLRTSLQTTRSTATMHTCWSSQLV